MRSLKYLLKIGCWCLWILAVVAEGRTSAESAAACPPLEERAEGYRNVSLPVDLRQVRRLQLAFEDGHQPWRGDAVSVAANAVSVTLATKLAGEDRPEDLERRLAVECESRAAAIVAGTGSQYRYKVYLKRLGQASRGTAIWTAVKLFYAPK